MIKTMNKMPRRRLLNLDVRSAIIIIVVLAIGIIGGMLYSHYLNKSTATSSGGLPPSSTGPICNCPNIPVGGSIQQYCKC